MSRTALHLLQVLVAAVAIGLWYVFTTYEIFTVMELPPTSSRRRSISRTASCACSRAAPSGSICGSRSRNGSRLRNRLGRRRAGGLLVRPQARLRRRLRPLHQDVNALPRVVLAPIFTLWLGLGTGPRSHLG